MIGIFTADIKWALFSEFQENALNINFITAILKIQ